MSDPVDLQSLLNSALNGNKHAFGELLEHFRSQLRETLYANIQGPIQRRIDESDVIQQACIQALGAFDQFRGSTIEEFWGWLEQIQRNTLIDVVRNQQAQRRDPRQEKSAGDANLFAGQNTTPSQKAMRGENRRRVENAINELPEGQREAVRLRHLEGRQISEVAELIGRSPAATAQLIYRGVSALKIILEQDNS